MRLIRPVVVKHIVTKEKKSQLIQRFSEDLLQTKRELEQLSFQLHKALRNAKEHENEVHVRYHKEIQSREEKVKNITFQIQQVEKLEEGMEIQEGKVDSIIDVDIGDTWSSLGRISEIIIKDGIIEEIRESGNDDDGLV